MAGNSSPKPPSPIRARRGSPSSSSPVRPYRLALRLIGIPVLAVAGVLIYRGLHDRFVLPECDSGRAKDTLADILKQLKYQPLRYEPIKTISSSKDEVVCNAVLPLRGRRQPQRRLQLLLARQQRRDEVFDIAQAGAKLGDRLAASASVMSLLAAHRTRPPSASG